jgi:hypothetical protein
VLSVHTLGRAQKTVGIAGSALSYQQACFEEPHLPSPDTVALGRDPRGLSGR